MKVLVTGGRDFAAYEDRMWLYDGLKLINDRIGTITEIVEGGARGADLAAKNWALWRQACGDAVTLTTVEAEWERYSAGLKSGQKNPAGAIRNTAMARLTPDLVLACPGGGGTAHMVATAKAHGLKVVFLEKMPVSRRASPNRPTEARVGL